MNVMIYAIPPILLGVFALIACTDSFKSHRPVEGFILIAIGIILIGATVIVMYPRVEIRLHGKEVTATVLEVSETYRITFDVSDDDEEGEEIPTVCLTVRLEDGTVKDIYTGEIYTMMDKYRKGQKVVLLNLNDKYILK